MSKFIISAKEPVAGRKDIVSRFVDSKKWPYWHWFDDLWLLAEVPESHNAKSIYDELMSAYPDLEEMTVIVFEVKDDSPQSYWGKTHKDGWEWMKKYWVNSG